MKWLGQHIYDLVSRFRNSVYLEDISAGTIASGGNLGLDSNNKIVKDDGDGVTDLTSAGVDGDNNQLLTDDGDGTVTSEANLTFNGSTLSVEADSNTTANALFIDANSLTTGSAISLDIDDALTATATKSLINIDYDKAGVTAASATSTTYGLNISMEDSATNDADGDVFMIGAQIDVDIDNNQGDMWTKGLEINVGADGVGDNGRVFGIDMTCKDGGTDIALRSDANVADHFKIATTANGATSLTTVDGSGADANLSIVADGTVDIDSAGILTLDSGAAINIEPASGSSILLDGTVTVDAGSVTGITTLGVDSVSLTAVQTSAESFVDNDTSIMTSAAIDDKINTKYSTSYITFSALSQSSFGTNYIFTHVKGISEVSANQDSGVDASGGTYADFGGVTTEQGGSGTDAIVAISSSSLEQQIPIPETCKLMGFFATTSSYNDGNTAGYDTGVAIWRVPESGVDWGGSNDSTATLIHKSDSSRSAMTGEGTNKRKVQKVERMDGTVKSLAAGDILIPSIFGETADQQIMATITLVIATPIKTI